MKLISFHRRIISLFKIISILGIFITLYLVYISFKLIKNDFIDIVENNNITLTASNINNKPEYEIAIQNLLFEGVNKKLTPYQIHAHQAIKISGNQYKFDQVNGLYKLNRHNNLMINANKAILNQTSQMLQLKNNVQLFLGDAIFNTNALEINLVHNEISSNSRITLFYKNSQITANSFISKNNNNIVNFKGHVSTSINMSDF